MPYSSRSKHKIGRKNNKLIARASFIVVIETYLVWVDAHNRVRIAVERQCRITCKHQFHVFFRQLHYKNTVRRVERTSRARRGCFLGGLCVRIVLRASHSLLLLDLLHLFVFKRNYWARGISFALWRDRGSSRMDWSWVLGRGNRRLHRLLHCLRLLLEVFSLSLVRESHFGALCHDFLQ